MRKLYFTDEERKAARLNSTKKYYASDKGKETKRKYDKEYRHENQSKLHAYRQERRHTKSGYVDRFIERAKKHTKDTDLTRETVLDVFGDTCSITNKPFEYVNRFNSYHNPLAPSIDRIDSTKGYYKGNIQIVLSCINRMKNDSPNEEFLELWKALTNVQQ